jgi:hypothetical protein
LLRSHKPLGAYDIIEQMAPNSLAPRAYKVRREFFACTAQLSMKIGVL